MYKRQEESLTKSCEKFIKRFEEVEKLADARRINMKNSDIGLLNELWKEAKSFTQ